MITLEKLHQNLLDYNPILFKKIFEVNKKIKILVKKGQIQVILFMIMLTRSLKTIFNPMRYTGNYIIMCM